MGVHESPAAIEITSGNSGNSGNRKRFKKIYYHKKGNRFWRRVVSWGNVISTTHSGTGNGSAYGRFKASFGNDYNLANLVLK